MSAIKRALVGAALTLALLVGAGAVAPAALAAPPRGMCTASNGVATPFQWKGGCAIIVHPWVAAAVVAAGGGWVATALGVSSASGVFSWTLVSGLFSNAAASGESCVWLWRNGNHLGPVNRAWLGSCRA